MLLIEQDYGIEIICAITSSSFYYMRRQATPLVSVFLLLWGELKIPYRAPNKSILQTRPNAARLSKSPREALAFVDSTPRMGNFLKYNF